MKTVEWVQTKRREVHEQLRRAEMAAVGSPNFEMLVNQAHAYAYGQLHGLLDVLEREGLEPNRSRPLFGL